MEAGDAQKHIIFSNRNNNSIISVIFLFILLFSLVLISILWSNQKPIRNYVLSTLKYYSRKSIDSLISIVIAKENDLSVFEKEIEKFSFVKSCRIYHKDSETIEIEITEREPLLLISIDGNKFKLITTDLNFVSAEFLKSFDYPIFKVGNFDEKDLREKFTNLFTFLSNVKQAYPLVYANIQEIESGFQSLYLVTKSTRTKVILPLNPDIRQISILDDIFSCSNFSKYLKREIDLRFDGLVVTR